MASQYRKLPVEDGGAPGTVDSFNGRTGVVVSQSGDYTASQITNVPAGNISATNVQDAINELDAEKGGGTVTSVGLALPAGVFTISGSPVTTTGILTGSFTTQIANTVLAGPSSGGAATPAFRALVTADLPAGTGTNALTNTHIFVGNVSNIATDVAMSGDATIDNTGVLTLANTAVTPAAYGAASQVSTVTVDSKGRLTAASNTAIQIAESQVTNLVSDLAAKQSTTLTNGHILVGNVSNIATDVAVSGDVTISNTGVETITVGAVTDTKASLSNKPAVTVVAISNLTLSGAQTIDGQLTVAGSSSVLATGQTAPAENGPWMVQSGAWTRPPWFPSGGTTQAIQFSTYFIRLGTTYQGSTWRQTSAAPATIDSTSLTFAIAPLSLNSSTITGVLPVANGGTGLSSTPSNGQLNIGNGSGFTQTTLTAGSGIAITNGAGSISIATTGNAAVTSKTANYTVTSTDYVLFCNSSGGVFNLTLPQPSTVTGRMYRVIDTGGAFNTNNVTLVRFASEQISGLAASKPLTTNWGYYELISNGTDWFLGG